MTTLTFAIKYPFHLSNETTQQFSPQYLLFIRLPAHFFVPFEEDHELFRPNFINPLRIIINNNEFID